MKLSRLTGIIFISVIIGVLVWYFCTPSPPEGVTDKKPRRLSTPITAIKEGIPIAVARAHEWRKDLYLYYINAGFTGKEQIQKRKGIISYFFYADKAFGNLDTSARVDIDMNKNCIIHFSSIFGTPRELMGGMPLKTGKWKIDIDQIFDIAMTKLGEHRISKYPNPKIVLRCTKNFWEFSLLSNPNAQYDVILININPETGKINNALDLAQSEGESR